ncbi:shikimate kinase [Ectothiorhodospiraceae bacterium WFHF3C12]|nr:shikimate kinase [Ectothiorhodospiraceae bacterium WFHF3C12]
MPGAGKSTVGVLLAKALALGFVDTDLLIQSAEGRTLQDIVDSEGHFALRRIEERELRRLNVTHQVIATGGSAVYSPAAMDALRARGIVTYLRASLDTLNARITNQGTRGIAKGPEQSFADVYSERTPLYERYAEVIVDCDGLDAEATMEAIRAALPGD